ncbi:MAG: hypothetical protein IJV90_04420 [Candidatus Methanomethylophilaceae archaeon]|nr:hypothetical protein [Candidatus Methanomethylophilaceae archaeon]MBQ8644234.1 hypothetical protein [Candidatus Methanomethylophilaceae archaeon]
MDTKVSVVAVVGIMLVLAVGIYVVSDDGDGESRSVISAVARVNTDGSGIYMKASYEVSDFLIENDDGTYTFIKDGWAGKVFGTPGTSTIQHVQLQQIADSMGLKFVKYTEGDAKNKDTLYFSDTINNAEAATENNAHILDGGILWEPQYSRIISDSQYEPMVLTNDLFPGHACCVIAGYDEFMDSNRDATVAFLTAYVKGVKYVNEALADKGSEKYAEFIAICEKTTGLNRAVIEAALENVVYKYSDDNVSGSLDVLIQDIASLEKDLEDIETIKTEIQSLGFKDSTEFATALVDDSYLKDAVDENIRPLKSKTVIDVVAIAGDIHQIALNVADELGYFDEYNLDVNIRGVGNGGAVALDLLGGQSDFGLLGAPPLTINTVNDRAVTA